jgi:hypothetical protein
MQTSTLILVACLAALVIFTSCEGKSYFLDDDNMEMSEAKARSFLDDDDSPEKRNNNNNNKGDCVMCKFNTMRCCKPNVCVKKRFRPDECMEVKGK